MGETLGKLFVNVETLPEDGFGFFQVVFLGAVYAYILFNASQMISEGSELLLLTPAKGLVGSIVLPILGAVPDGAIILFSGASQAQLAVGVGALAGSTIMLLTVPWTLAIIAGRVALVDGRPRPGRPKCDSGSFMGQLYSTGALAGKSIPRAGWFMLMTMLSYFVIQGPAFGFGCATLNCGCPPGDLVCLREVARKERYWALVGLILCLFLFFLYLYDQLRGASGEETEEVRQRLRNDVAERAMSQGFVSLRGVFGSLRTSTDKKDLHNVLHHIFKHYDRDNSQTIDEEELALLIKDLHEEPGLAKFIKKADTDRDGKVSFTEFKKCIELYLEQGERLIPAEVGKLPTPKREEEEEEEEEEEMPEDLAHLDPATQQRRIWRRALTMMLGGTALVLFFSDPMVEVLDALGRRTGISSFYISFIMAPLASNASEFLAAYAYALKKTEKTFTISLSSLLGAACMNNTFCLAIFLFQIFNNSLLWEFTAETLSIAAVEVIMFFFSQRRLQRTWYSFVIFSLFPLSLLMVGVLEGLGLD